MNSDDKVVGPDCVVINCACMSVTESEITFLKYTVNLIVEMLYLQGIAKNCVPLYVVIWFFLHILDFVTQSNRC